MTNLSKPVQTYDGELLRHSTTAERLAMTDRLGPKGVKIPNGWTYWDTTLPLPLPLWWDRNV